MKQNYYDITSSRLHPWVKEFALVLTIVLVIMKPGVQGPAQAYIVWLGALAILLAIAKLNVRRLLVTMIAGAFMSGILVVSQGFLYKASGTTTPLFTIFVKEIGGRSIGTFTQEGLVVGLVGSLKIFCIIVGGQILAATTKIEDFAYSLIKLRIPRLLTFVLVTGMRFVPLVAQTWHEIFDAQRLRGYDVDKVGIIKKITELYPRSLVSLVLILFKAGLNMDIAIQTRGFHVEGKKTLYYTLSLRRVDYAVLVGLSLLFGWAVALSLK